MSYVSITQDQLRHTLQQALTGRLSETVAARVVGRQVHLIYRTFGHGGKFYLRVQDRKVAGVRSVSHAGMVDLLRDGAMGFIQDAPQATHLAELQLRALVFRFGRRGLCYLARGPRDLRIPESTEREIFAAWYLGGDEARPEILNAHGIAFNKLDEIIARGQAEGWGRQ